MGIIEPTVFIIGAGAHVDYRMPTGFGLINDLRGWCHDTSNGQSPEHRRVTAALQLICPTPSDGTPRSIRCDGEKVIHSQFIREVAALVRQLTGSRHDSIDSLLSRLGQEKQMLGKWIISALLLRYQADAVELPGIDGWHRWLAQQCCPPLHKSPGEWDFRNVSVITFNYDTLFELHMWTFVENDDALPPAVSPVPRPLHVYGELSVASSWDPEKRRFTIHPNSDMVFRSGVNLAIASSRSGPAKDATAIHSAIASAKQIVFLGFAFDPTNVARLGFNGFSKAVADTVKSDEVRIYSTAWEHDVRQMRFAQDMIGVAGDERFHWGPPKHSCADCLRDWALL